MSRKSVDAWNSTSILNHVFNTHEKESENLQCELMTMHLAPSKAGLKSVQFIKSRLGDQDYTWQGEFRYWVWERNGWRVFVSNTKGIGFEVDESLTKEQAFTAWHDFLSQIGAR